MEGIIVAETKLDRLTRWQAGEAPGPWLVTLFPTNRCNLKCKICWQRGATDIRKTVEVPDQRLLELVDECAEIGVRDWSIIGGGEPLLRGEVIMDICERIRANDMNGALQTNGTLLTEAYIERLISIGWSQINVSLDGPTREINDHIRSKGSFEQATSNIRLISELKQKLQVDQPLVNLYTVITSTNCDKIDMMVDLAHKLGCAPGGVQLTTMVVHSEEGEPLKLTEEQIAELPANINRAIDRAEHFGISNTVIP